jgi:integrase
LNGDRGRHLNYNHIREAFIKQIIEPLINEFPTPKDELGFKDGRFHSFRHFFVSECFAAGVPESDIRLWVGHSDSKVVALYRHIRDEIAKANIRKIDFGTS